VEIVRTKIIGKVIEEPRVAIGEGISCLISIEIQDNAGVSNKTYDIIISRGYKPWRVEIGTKGCAVGILRGGVLWADYFRSTKNVYQLTEQTIKTMEEAGL